MLVTFNARNEHDRCKFAEDLRESISEMDEMDTLRIEAELEKQKSTRGARGGNAENRDSGVADVEGGPFQSSAASSPAAENNGGIGGNGANGSTGGAGGAGTGHHHVGGGGVNEQPQQLKRSALSNSLLDMHEQCKYTNSTLKHICGIHHRAFELFVFVGYVL